ncbi:MAG: hypothetical protein CVU58_00570 [Deltaproteobacteria bacterium HGW-Deltaproteobacteria-16]|nr:MAG: hypothetical protein CVU58_00570 [Deltaproteobacteria bacterium HGW-Deltaproteobacteria-16]
MNYIAALSAFRLLVVIMALIGFGPSMVCAADEKPIPIPIIILEVSPENALEKKFIVVKRQGHDVDFTREVSPWTLSPGDRIFIFHEQASLTLYVGNRNEQLITARKAGKDGYVLQIKPNTVWGNLWAAFRSPNPHVSTASASARGIDEFKMPADTSNLPPPRMAAGERALHFRWVGGTPPYSLTIEHDGVKVSKVENVGVGSVSLPRRNWQPGKYQLSLEDAGTPQKVLEESELTFVKPADIPPMPKDIVEGESREDMRQLLYADWLSKQGKGKWIMEAIQRVVPLAMEGNLAAANWLRQWGGE